MVIFLIRHQYAQSLDNAAEIFIKQLRKPDRTAQKKLENYLTDHQKQTDNFISVLSGMIKVYLEKPDSMTVFDLVLGNNGEHLLQICERYMAFSGSNYLPFGKNCTILQETAFSIFSYY